MKIWPAKRTKRNAHRIVQVPEHFDRSFRRDLIRRIERDEIVWRGQRGVGYGYEADLVRKWAAGYAVRAKAFGYFVEATLDDGKLLQSDRFDAADHVLDTFEELRRRTMIARVRIIAAHTGVVFCDLPSRNTQVSTTRIGTVGATMVEIL